MKALMVRVDRRYAVELLTNPELVLGLVERSRANDDLSLEVDVYWAGIHVVLTSEPIIPREEALKRHIAWDDSSLENLFMGGIPTSAMTSFGPVRYLDPEQTLAMDRELWPVTDEQFIERYDADYLSELRVQPDLWFEDAESELLLSALRAVRTFLHDATAARDGLLIYFH